MNNENWTEARIEEAIEAVKQGTLTYYKKNKGKITELSAKVNWSETNSIFSVLFHQLTRVINAKIE